MHTDVVINQESPRQEGVIRLLETSDAYAASLYPSDSNHMLALEALECSNVAFLVARAGDAILGCAALVDQSCDTGEIKRMFVAEQARGLKLGRRLLDRLEDEARLRGITTLRLETGIRQPEAIGLYRKAGYVEIATFGDYLPDPLSLFMEKKLAR